ncbi:MAG TPA: YwiC-like family protein, partial [Pyrinomonadaceae bacterium]|nr:YwiC-like family protein [Pyrinomonadaceae bacterium]
RPDIHGALAMLNSITQAPSSPRKQRMMFTTNQVKSANGVRIRPVALPVEHGGWGLLFEPILLGLLLAPSLPGLLLSFAAIGAFLARHPFKLAVGDWRRNRRSARTAMAERFALTYFVIAALGLSLAIRTGGWVFLLPLLFAAPIALVQLFYDSMGRSRALIAELAGAIATGALAGAIAMAGGWSRAMAFGLWAILAARTVPTILYLRTRLRLLRRKPASPRLVIIAHLLAIAFVFGLVLAGIAPVLAILAVVILLLRAAVGFSKSDRGVTAKRLGLRELMFGAVTVFAVILGYKIGL